MAIGGRYLTVRWLRADIGNLTEPFFAPSISLMRACVPVPLESETDLETIAAGSRHLTPMEPAGIIIHMTRCGSTAVANALRTAERTTVLSEAAPVDSVMHLSLSRSPSLMTLGRRVLPAIVAVFANCQGAPARKLIIKCGLEGAAFLPLIRDVWPRVPCLILVRDPLEVMVSNIQRPAPWLMLLKSRTEGAPADDSNQDREWVELASKTLGNMCGEMHRHLYESCFVLDHSRLSPTAVLEVADRFGLQFTSDGREEFHRSLRQYSKDRKRTFEDDTAAKQSGADDWLKECVAKWAADPYKSLLTAACCNNLSHHA